MGAVEILNLRQAFDERQSAAIAQFFDANAATKRDIEEVRLEIEKVRAEIEKVRSDLGTGIEKVRADLSVEIESVRAELKADIAGVRRDIEQVRADLAEKLLRYQVGGVVSIGVIIALVRILG